MSQEGLPTRSKRIRSDGEVESDAEDEAFFTTEPPTNISDDMTLLDREENNELYETYETVGGLRIEKLEEKTCNIQTHFTLSSDTKSVVVIDQGSSFSKGKVFNKNLKMNTFHEEPIRFNVNNRSATEFARTILYYSPSSEDYTLHKDQFEDAIPIHSLKKLFTVLEANTYIVKDRQDKSYELNVSNLMFKFIEKLLKAITWKKQNDKFTRNVDSFIFTVPTATPKHVKSFYKLNVFKAIQECFVDGPKLKLDNIYIIEEYLLLYYTNINEHSIEKIVMIIDFGHLTAANMIHTNCQNVSISDSLPSNVYIEIDFERKLIPFQTKIAFLFEDEDEEKDQDKLKLKLTKNDYFLNVMQDVEIFILKIRNTIDMKLLEKTNITKENFKKVGISEFERFSTAKIWFDPELKINHAAFFTVGEVYENEVIVSIIFRGKAHYFRKKFKIPRVGRMERIPVTDIEVVFTPDEEETRTWYGTKYDLNMIVSALRVHRVDRLQLSELDEDDFKTILSEENIITDEDIEEYDKYDSKIKALQKKDVENYYSLVNFKCISCGKEIENAQSHKITSRTVYRYRDAFENENIHPGSACHDCFKIQRNYRDRNMGSKKKKKK